MTRAKDWLGIAATGCLTAVLAGCGGGSGGAPSAKTFTLRGDLALSDGGERVSHCNPQAASSATDEDIQPGAQVVVKNAAGTTVAEGSLGSPKATGNGIIGTCNYPFAVASVPASNFYAVSIASHSGVTVTAAQARSGNVHLTLDGN